jgi:protein-tyrosine phosphatase
VQTYSDILDQDFCASRVQSSSCAHSAAVPTLVHCTAGKDRTGIVVAALLLAAGVIPEAVVDDYVARAANMPALQQRGLDTGVRYAGSRPLGTDALDAPVEAITLVASRLSDAPPHCDVYIAHTT